MKYLTRSMFKCIGRFLMRVQRYFFKAICAILFTCKLKSLKCISIGRYHKGRAIRYKSALVPRCGLSTAIPNAEKTFSWNLNFQNLGKQLKYFFPNNEIPAFAGIGLIIKIPIKQICSYPKSKPCSITLKCRRCYRFRVEISKCYICKYL